MVFTTTDENVTHHDTPRSSHLAFAGQSSVPSQGSATLRNMDATFFECVKVRSSEAVLERPDATPRRLFSQNVGELLIVDVH